MAEYSVLDRLLHKIAFNNIEIQKKLSSIEDKVWKQDLENIRIEKPVFVTSMARAGTTILLEVLGKDSEFVTYSYRSMPFLLIPILWSKLSSNFKQKEELKERAHGDGIEISYDSPEAFEEVLWMAFYESHYGESYIRTWQDGDYNPEFNTFFCNHVRKLIFNGRKIQNNVSRYLSKNNANIARIPLLLKIFPDCKIVVPVRDPQEHILSIIRQHKRFLEKHKLDHFSLEYMKWLGHFEFGKALKPFLFDSRLKDFTDIENNYEFWAVYWMEVYKSIYQLALKRDNIYFFDHEDACNNTKESFDKLLEFIESSTTSSELPIEKFRPKTTRQEIKDLSSDTKDQLYTLYEDLRKSTH